MIVSHEHRFIFLKTAKTAGTSIEIALSGFCGPRDVITEIEDSDETIRRGLGLRGPQNFRLPYSKFETMDWLRFVGRRARPQFFNHIPAAAARHLLGDETWTTYFKFAVERNPFDKVVSAYFYINRSRPRPWPPLSEWVCSDPGAYVRGFDIYAIAGHVAVDRVLRYEHLGPGLGEVAHRLGLPPIELPDAKRGFRTDRRPYQELLDEDARRWVEVAYAREIALLGYEF